MFPSLFLKEFIVFVKKNNDLSNLRKNSPKTEALYAFPSSY